MREIGSEFWTGCTPAAREKYTMRPKTIYRSHLYKIVETLSGRTALEHIVEILVNKGMKTAYLPSYCCHTMIEPFLAHGMKVSFYDVQMTNKGLHRVILEEEYDTILLMDYFGHTDDETLDIAIKEKEKGKTVIYDATHSMYSPVNTEPYDFVYGSYRKWVDINCGFLAWKEELYNGEITQNGANYEYANIRQELFDKKADFMSGGSTKKDGFLPLVNEAESTLERMYHHKMPDERSKDVLKHADAEYIINKRRVNARALTESTNDLNDDRVRCITPLLNTFDTPLFVAVAVEADKRDALRKHLIDNQIYCPVHWPISDIHKMMPGSKHLFESELSLICDQRYNEEDMYRIADTIKEFFQS